MTAMPSTQTAVNGSRPDVDLTGGPVPAGFTTQAPPPAPARPADPAPAEAKRPRSKRKTEITLVVAAWLAATTLAVEGAWAFFGDTLHLALIPRCAAFAVFEISAVACAVMARRRRIDDIDSRWGGTAGVAVWVFAAVSGVLSASHEVIWWGEVARFAAPLMSAFLFDLLTSGEQGDARQRAGHKRKRINFKLSPERVLVRLGLADGSDRTAEDAARDRAIARVATLCHRAQLALAGKNRVHAETAYRRALEAANERFGLARDDKLMAQLRTSIALLDGAMDMTSTEAIANSSNPWVNARRPAARPATGGGERRTTSRVTTRPDPTGGRGRFSPEERLEQYDAVVAERPGLTQEQYAAAIGLRPRQLRDVLSKTGRTASTG